MEKYCTAGQTTDGNIIRRMRIACWIPKTTNTHSEYEICIAFQLQQWLQERASMLRYTYITCLVYLTLFNPVAQNKLFLGRKNGRVFTPTPLHKSRQ